MSRATCTASASEESPTRQRSRAVAPSMNHPQVRKRFIFTVRKDRQTDFRRTQKRLSHHRSALNAASVVGQCNGPALLSAAKSVRDIACASHRHRSNHIDRNHRIGPQTLPERLELLRGIEHRSVLGMHAMRVKPPRAAARVPPPIVSLCDCPLAQVNMDVVKARGQNSPEASTTTSEGEAERESTGAIAAISRSSTSRSIWLCFPSTNACAPRNRIRFT